MNSNETSKARGIAWRAFAVVLACALAIWTMAVPLGSVTQALADEDGYTITIEDATSGTYSAYQILTGSYTSDDEMGGDAAVNSSIQSALLAALTATGSAYTVTIGYDDDGNASTITFIDYDDPDENGGYSSTTVDYGATWLAYAVMCQIEQIGTDGVEKTFAANLANAIASASVTADATTTLTEAGTATLSVDETGYYLVVQSGATTGDNSSAILVNVTEDGATATSKNSSDTPTADKEVVEDDDDNSIVYNEDGTASISYTITGTVAENIADYSTYYYSVVDTLPDGVTISDTTSSITDLSITIATSGTAYTVTSSFTQSASTADDVCTVSWTCSDILSLTDADGTAVAVTSTTTVKVSYTLVICADELDAITAAANSDTGQFVNTANIVFSNNPYATGTGEGNTGTSTDDEGSVQLYNLIVYKVDGDGTALTGASFTLTGDNGYSVELSVNSDGSTFTFTGLEAGVTYTLSETSVPDGYKSIQDVTFTVGENTTHTYDDDGNVLTTTTYPTVDEDSDLSECAEFGTSTTDANTITATITNLPGNTLPTTGLSGRTLALLAGLLLIIVCAGLLLRRRNATNE